jgi:ferredoxin-NADP reductase
MPNPVKIESVVESIDTLDTDVFMLTFDPCGKVPKFKPGQFLHIALDTYDPSGGFWPESRVFSIASSPRDPLIKIIYSVKGRFTARMRDEIKIGTKVWIKLPFGDFVIAEKVDPTQGIVLIAGGTGISPFLPFLEKMSIDNSCHSPVWLFWGARNSRLLAPKEAVQRCVTLGSVRVSFSVEEGTVENMDSRIETRDGRLDITRIREETRALQRPVFFLSGPPAMIQAFKDYLLSDGAAAGDVILDEWE